MLISSPPPLLEPLFRIKLFNYVSSAGRVALWYSSFAIKAGNAPGHMILIGQLRSAMAILSKTPDMPTEWTPDMPTDTWLIN
jgi:hypothetical protein